MKYLLSSIALIVLMASCKTPQNYTYFKDLSDSIANYSILDTGYRPVIVKPDDILQINISSPNTEANAFFVVPGSSTGTGTPGNAVATTPNPNTYLVDKEGAIDLPLVGQIFVAGNTTIQVKNIIRNKVLTVLKDPIVTVRLQNFKVTVLGEVNRPANYIVPSERVSLLDAIGLAGDLTIYGKRENVLVIRESKGKKTFNRLNLNSTSIFQSQFFYLQQNDIVYVEPNKQKAAASDVSSIRYLTIITSLASFVAIIISRILFK